MQRFHTQYGTSGMVCSAHPYATLSGLKVLAAGGNAVDAAMAIAGTTCVTIPPMCGLGGDAFAIIWDAKSRRAYAFGGSGTVPQGSTLEHYNSLGYSKMPTDGILSVAVPGAVDAYYTMLERFGTMKMKDLWADAIFYAKNGFPMTPWLKDQIAVAAQKLSKYQATSKVLLPGGKVPEVGDTLVQKDLATSLEKVATQGRDVMYRGELAEALVKYSRSAGGLFDGAELSSHATDEYVPLSTGYRGYEILQTAPPSQGLIMLEEMNILEGFDLGSMSPDSAEAIHLMVEAKRLAFEDRNRYMGDPRFIDAPTAALISKEYAAKRRSRINPASAMADIPEDSPYHTGDTTSFVVIDKWGTAVSFIHSLSNAFGSCATIPGTGILLNNRAGRGFILQKGHKNCIAPGKRTMHTLNTYMVLQDGEPYLIANTPGGDGQPQHNMQMAVNVLDFGMDPQQAAEAPRWTHSPGTDPVNLGSPLTLQMESRYPEETMALLRAKGHNVKPVGAWAGGGTYQLIKVDRAKKVYMGGTDPRAECLALGY